MSYLASFPSYRGLLVKLSILTGVRLFTPLFGEIPELWTTLNLA